MAISNDAPGQPIRGDAPPDAGGGLGSTLKILVPLVVLVGVVFGITFLVLHKPSDDVPIHPLRLCEEVKNFMQRDAILVVDGQEILNYGRQSMPTFSPGHRLNSGPFGTMKRGTVPGTSGRADLPSAKKSLS